MRLKKVFLIIGIIVGSLSIFGMTVTATAAYYNSEIEHNAQNLKFHEERNDFQFKELKESITRLDDKIDRLLEHYYIK